MENETFEAMERKWKIAEATELYINALGMSKAQASEIATARADGNIDAEANLLRKFMKNLKAEIINSQISERRSAAKESKAVKIAKALPHESRSVDENILKAYM